MYRFLKKVISFLLSQFFSEINIRGAAMREEGATLIVVNHPNLALDSLLIARSFKRDLWFIAKATLFANPMLHKFFTACHMLPVKRRQDNPDAPVDNQDTFSKVVDKLCSNQAVVIFPEGVSLGERKILPLKTGAARMAFEAEEHHSFKLGLKIQAAGITYSKLDAFKSRVTITFSEPISIQEYKAEYEKDAQNSVKLLTERIEKELRDVTVTVANEEHIELIEKISNIYRSSDSTLNDTELMQTIARNVERHSAKELSDRQDIIERIDIYSDLSSLFAVDGTFALEQKVNKNLILCTLPFFFVAYLINIFPYRLVGNQVKKSVTHPVYTASAKFGYGLAIFFCWYVLLSMFFSILTGSFLNFILALIFCLMSGYLLNKYLNHINLFIISYFWPVSKKPLDLLLLIRDDLITELNSIRVD